MISLWFVEWRVTIDNQDKPQASAQKETACSDWAPPWIHTEKGWVDTHSLLIACFIPANCHTFTVIFTHFHIKIGSATHQAFSLIYKFATHFYHCDQVCHSFLWFLLHILSFLHCIKVGTGKILASSVDFVTQSSIFWKFGWQVWCLLLLHRSLSYSLFPSTSH